MECREGVVQVMACAHWAIVAWILRQCIYVGGGSGEGGWMGLRGFI